MTEIVADKQCAKWRRLRTDVRKKVFTVTTALPPDSALDRLAQLLEAGGAEVCREGGVVRSVRTPTPVVNIDPRMYSDRNRVGINPFALLTAIEMSATESATGTVVNVSIDRTRVILIWALFVCPPDLCIAASVPFGTAVAFAGMTLAVCAVALRWAHTLTRFEIEQQLES
jgi:hypothetical protein